MDQRTTNVNLVTSGAGMRSSALVGVSQEELAVRAGASQGAVSRLEAGRAVNTPLITVMKINAAMRDALTALGPDLLSEETRRIMDVGARETPAREEDFEAVPLTVHPLLADLVQLFWQVPERQHRNFVVLMGAAARMLAESVTA